MEVLNRLVAVPMAEDVIINKLRWFKLAKRRKDFEDARNVLAVQHEALDWADLRAWCRRLALEAELGQAEKVIHD